MGKKLYVGNLPYTITEDSLSEAFNVCGTVESVKIITDKMSGRSRGFAFVEMSNDNEAQAAIQSLHGKDFQGRTLTVNEAREESAGGGRRDGGGGGGRHGGGGGGDRGPRGPRRDFDGNRGGPRRNHRE